MRKKAMKPAPPSRAPWRWRVAGTLAVLVLGLITFWWLSGGRDAGGGRPSLVVDREAVDLGDFPFEAPARAVFTLTNRGDGILRLAEVPRVKAVKGC